MSLTAAATGGDSAPVAGERCGTAFSLDLNVGVFFFFFFCACSEMHAQLGAAASTVCDHCDELICLVFLIASLLLLFSLRDVLGRCIGTLMLKVGLCFNARGKMTVFFFPPLLKLLFLFFFFLVLHSTHSTFIGWMNKKKRKEEREKKRAFFSMRKVCPFSFKVKELKKRVIV